MTLPARDQGYWKPLLVNYPQIKGTWDDEATKAKMVTYLAGLPKDNLVHLGNLISVPVDIVEAPRQLAVRLVNSPAGLVLACLKDFLNGKAQAVDRYWEDLKMETPREVFRVAAFSRLVSIYGANPDHLRAVFVLHSWISRAGGVTYVARDRDLIDSTGLEQKLEKVAGAVTGHAKALFKLVGQCQTPYGQLRMLYRQDEEKLLEAWEPTSYLDAQPVLFRIGDNGNFTELEVKSETQWERSATITALGELLDTEWSERADDPFDAYETGEIQRICPDSGPFGQIARFFGQRGLRSQDSDVICQKKGIPLLGMGPGNAFLS